MDLGVELEVDLLPVFEAAGAGVTAGAVAAGAEGAWAAGDELELEDVASVESAFFERDFFFVEAEAPASAELVPGAGVGCGDVAAGAEGAAAESVVSDFLERDFFLVVLVSAEPELSADCA